MYCLLLLGLKKSCWYFSAKCLSVRVRVWPRPDVPVRNVSAANHGGQVGDGVARHTHLVEVGVLTNQVADQEATVRAATQRHLVAVKPSASHKTFNSKLQEEEKEGGTSE